MVTGANSEIPTDFASYCRIRGAFNRNYIASMPTIGSETYRSTTVPDATLETRPDHEAPEVVKGEDWPELAPLPEPVLLGLNPDNAPVPGPDQLVVVHGTGFTLESIIVWNNQDVFTVFEREDKINTTISMTAEGVDPVYVRNGDLKSNVLEFTFTAAEGRKKHGK
jgi:hypothetical protein